MNLVGKIFTVLIFVIALFVLIVVGVASTLLRNKIFGTRRR